MHWKATAGTGAEDGLRGASGGGSLSRPHAGDQHAERRRKKMLEFEGQPGPNVASCYHSSLTAGFSSSGLVPVVFLLTHQEPDALMRVQIRAV